MMIFLKVPGSWNNAVAGAVLLAIVVFDYIVRRTVRNRQIAMRAAEIHQTEPGADASLQPREATR
jgi:AI-2 transport system permease protein